MDCVQTIYLSMDIPIRNIGVRRRNYLIRRTNHMKTTIRRMMGFLGVVSMATQLIGTVAVHAADFRGSSGSFERAMPVTPAQKEVEKLLRQISSNAAVTGKHADRLETFTRVGS